MNAPTDTTEWSVEERELLARHLAGETVVMRRTFRGGKRHARLEAWARTHDLFVRIDRGTDWANRHKMTSRTDPQERAQVIARYRDDLLADPDLLAKVPTLRGKLLACHCYPLPCHGDVLAALADEGVDR